MPMNAILIGKEKNYAELDPFVCCSTNSIRTKLSEQFHFSDQKIANEREYMDIDIKKGELKLLIHEK